MKEMAIIEIDERLCKGCNYCVEMCPKGVLAKSDKLSPKGYLIPEVLKPDNCVICRTCERICPDFAISVHKLPSNSP